MKKELAKIKSFKLNIGDRGILMFWITVDYESGCSQGVGGLVLDEYDKEAKTRVGTAYGCEMIRQLMLTLKVDDFADAKDKLIYVLGEGEGCQAGDEQLKAGVEIGCCTNPKDFGIKLEDFGVNADTYHKLPHAINATPGKPVFTQEMADAGDRPKAMMECLVFNTLLVSPKYEKAVIDFIGEWCCVYTSESCRERSASVDDLLFKPIDNRTDEQKLISALSDEFDGWTFEEFSNYNYAKILLESDKFTITLNKE